METINLNINYNKLRDGISEHTINLLLNDFRIVFAINQVDSYLNDDYNFNNVNKEIYDILRELENIQILNEYEKRFSSGSISSLVYDKLINFIIKNPKLEDIEVKTYTKEQIIDYIKHKIYNTDVNNIISEDEYNKVRLDFKRLLYLQKHYNLDKLYAGMIQRIYKNLDEWYNQYYLLEKFPQLVFECQTKLYDAIFLINFLKNDIL